MKSLLLLWARDSTVTIKMLAFSATTLWGRKRNKQALAVRGMVSALREGALYYGITEVG